MKAYQHTLDGSVDIGARADTDDKSEKGLIRTWESVTLALGMNGATEYMRGAKSPMFRPELGRKTQRDHDPRCS